MKSSFLFTLILVFIATSLGAQTTPSTAKEGSFDKFYERLKISYFGAYGGSSLGQWDDRALDEKGTKDYGYVNNLFNQISFNYNFGAKMNFVLNPRWTVNLANTSGHTAETNGLFVVEDLLSGFQGVLYNSPDKKFTYWTRIALRLPTSRTSRKDDITFQPDWMSIPTYDFNPTWQLGSYVALRHWVYQDRFTAYRYRVYVAPYIQYVINDTTKLQLYYENYCENRKNLESQNGKDPNFNDKYQNAMLAVSLDLTPKFNFMPFIGYYLDAPKTTERPLDPAWLGFWASYSFK